MRLLLTSLLSLILSFSLFGQSPCNNQTSITYQGYEYDIIEIGDQCWFAENCRYLPAVSPSNEGSETEPYFYVYGYEGTDVEAAQTTSNYETYGVLYNWPAVISEDLCPTGWHISFDEDWQNIEVYLGMSESDVLLTGWRGTDQGFQMKSITEWNNNFDGFSGNGTNSSGVNIFPGGYWVSSTGTANMNNIAFFWTPSIDFEPFHRFLSNQRDDILRVIHPLNYAMSIRCTKDELVLNYDGNNDSCITIQDLLNLLLEYGQCAPETQLDYDGNGDGCVNGEDVLNILVEYGSCE